MNERFTNEELLAELYQCKSTIEFLHWCLTEPEFNKYFYPEQTLERIKHLNKIVPTRIRCAHSIMKHECEGCLEGHKLRMLRQSVREKLRSEI